MQRFVSDACGILNCDRASLFLVDQQRKELWCYVSPDAEIHRKLRVPIGKGIVGHAAESGQYIYIKDCYSDKRFFTDVDKRTGYTTKNLMCAPVKDHAGKTVAVVQCLNSLNQNGQFGHDEKMLFASFSKGIGQVISRYKTIPLIFKSKLFVKT